MSEEGDDWPPRLGRKIKKVMMLSSESGSDSDDSITAIGTRRKRMKVLSDSEGASSSGSSIGVGTRRKRTLPRVRDSDGDSDSSGWTTEPETAGLVQASKPTSGFASDSSEGNSDKCSICLLRFTDQQVGTPQSCEHIFCLDCITEWSKNVNTCPVDRMTFDVIVVRACAGGKVLRTEPVKIVERRLSVDMLVVDTTMCEICGSTDDEETMLLCDSCDRGYHMQCLTPPLSQIPVDRWLCPNCDDLLDVIEVDNIYLDYLDSVGSGSAPLRGTRNTRSSRHNSSLEEPSTSMGHRSDSMNGSEPTTSRGLRSQPIQRSAQNTSRRKATATHRTRRKYKRRRTRTVIIEYEVQLNGKFPITKKVKRKIKKRKVKRRQPRTAARLSRIRAGVRAQLAALRGASSAPSALSAPASASTPAASLRDLSAMRQRAGIPSLSIFGNRNQLDYFSEEEQDLYESSTTAVAVRPTSSILSEYRQARRKMIAVPSPPHASSAPDILSNILESQTLLHSKNSVVSVNIDGKVNIKLESVEHLNKNKRKPSETQSNEKVDLSKGEKEAKQVPSYPGQSRGGGGWGGGYRGNYHREQGSNNFNRGGYSNDNNYGGGYQSRQGNPYIQNNNMRRDDVDQAQYNNYQRRPNQYTHNEDSQFDRNRRQPDQNRGPNQHLNPRLNDSGRYSIGPSWQPYGGLRPEPSNQSHQQRHSFGGFENPVDMRMGHVPSHAHNNSSNTFMGSLASNQDKPQLTPQMYPPLPEPPLFKFDKSLDTEKSEDERSDSGLVIDTEKYDPTEPTHDDDSGDEDDSGHNAPHSGCHDYSDGKDLVAHGELPVQSSPPSNPALAQDPIQNILAGIDTSAINVPHNILDSAVREVLKEHRNWMAPPNIQQNDKSDNESDGDCPNFSIYSATSVHIANNTSNLTVEATMASRHDSLEDLVQEDDDFPTPEPMFETSTDSRVTPEKALDENLIASSLVTSIAENNRSEEEYKEKVSKRCPITTNTRNPIKIKLNTPSLIKRQVTLYDEEEEVDEENEEVEQTPKTVNVVEQCEENSRNKETSHISEKASPKQVDKSNEVHTIDRVSMLEEDKERHSIEGEISKENAQKTKISGDSKNIDIDLQDNGVQIENKFDNYSENLEKPTNIIEENKETSVNDEKSEMENEDVSDLEDEDLNLDSQSPKKPLDDRNGDPLEKLTESISETEDERSYTPCLDENKSKDTSLETEKDKGIEGLDTEMISEEEGNEIFSDNERARSEKLHISPEQVIPPPDGEEGEIVDKKKEKPEEVKKKKKKDSKKEGKEKGKKKKGEVGFKKLSKSGKERNYRDKDKEEKGKKREKRGSSEGGEREKQKQKRKEKRKDLERYDVRTVVSEKRKKPKDPFGRDISPRVRSRSLSRSSVAKRSLSRPRRSMSRERHSISRGRGSPARIRRSLSVSPPLRARRSVSKARLSPFRPRRSASPPRIRRLSPSPVLRRSRLSPSPMGRRGRLSPSPATRRGRFSPSPVVRRPRISPSPGPGRRSRISPSPAVRRARLSPSPRSPSLRAFSPRRSISPRRRRRRSSSRVKRAEGRRRRSGSRPRKRRRSASASKSPKSKPKKKKRARSERPASRRRSPRKKSPKRRRTKRRSESREPEPSPNRVAPHPPEPTPELTPVAWSPGSVDSRLLSPRTPPPEEMRRERRRRDPERLRHRRLRDVAGPSKEVFTSGDNILVSVSFKDQERPEEEEERRERRRERRRRRRKGAAADADTAAVKPVAIIDLERSPFRELTPSPKNVIVLSDSEPGEKEEAKGAASAVAEGGKGPQTPPSPSAAVAAPAAATAAAPPASAAVAPTAAAGAGAGVGADPRGPNTPPSPPDSPDAYDPYEPTRSASGSPSASPALPSPLPFASPAAPGAPAAGPAPTAVRPLMTLETAQKTNMSADEVLDRRPLSPIEKVMALLQSTRDVSPEPGDPQPMGGGGDALGLALAAAPGVPPALASAPPPAPSAAPLSAPRILLPEALRPQPPKLFLAKPSPIKSDPIKPMQAVKISRPPQLPLGLGGGDSPYSPGSSDFGDLFEPPSQGRRGGGGGGGAGGEGRDAFDALFERQAQAQAHGREGRKASRHHSAKVPVRLLDRKKGKMQVDVKIDDENLKILDDLPSSAVEMQVKSKFLKKLNRQERVVEEVKLVLKPHYNKKRLSKDQYKDILRRAVPKICHNKTGEINPSKIQALVEAYVKKVRKRHKLGLA